MRSSLLNDAHKKDKKAAGKTETISKAEIFVKRKRSFTLTFIAVAALFVGSVYITDYNIVDGVLSVPQAMIWTAENLLPDERAFDLLPDILTVLAETALVSVAVTVCAAVTAFFFSLFGTNTMKPNVFIARMVRIVAAYFRNVPDVVWAILLLFSFGQNVLTGFFALFFTTFGFLTRTFIEMTDEVSSSCVEALKATGATPLQIVAQGILPSTMAEVVSWVLYMIETNIRASTLIGILTATGIGALFNLYYNRFDFSAAGLVVITIVVLVIVIEIVSSRIRKVIL